MPNSSSNIAMALAIPHDARADTKHSLMYAPTASGGRPAVDSKQVSLENPQGIEAQKLLDSIIQRMNPSLSMEDLKPLVKLLQQLHSLIVKGANINFEPLLKLPTKKIHPKLTPQFTNILMAIFFKEPSIELLQKFFIAPIFNLNRALQCLIHSIRYINSDLLSKDFRNLFELCFKRILTHIIIHQIRSKYYSEQCFYPGIETSILNVLQKLLEYDPTNSFYLKLVEEFNIFINAEKHQTYFKETWNEFYKGNFYGEKEAINKDAKKTPEEKRQALVELTKNTVRETLIAVQKFIKKCLDKFYPDGVTTEDQHAATKLYEILNTLQHPADLEGKLLEWSSSTEFAQTKADSILIVIYYWAAIYNHVEKNESNPSSAAPNDDKKDANMYALITLDAATATAAASYAPVLNPIPSTDAKTTVAQPRAELYKTEGSEKTHGYTHRNSSP